MKIPRVEQRLGSYIVSGGKRTTKAAVCLAIRVAKAGARPAIGTIKWGGILGLLSFALIKTPGIAKVVNDGLRLLGKLPEPVANRGLEPKEFIDGKPVDMFAANFDGFPLVQKAINEAKEDAKTKGKNLDLNLDLDNSGWILDKPIEIEKLITVLKLANKEKFKDAINVLEMIDMTGQLIFSSEGPKAFELVQGGRPNCELMGALQALLLSPNGEQKLKAKYKVIDFNYLSDDGFIETTFELPSGEQIFVSWGNLEKWMSFFAPSHSKKGTLFVPIATYAMNEGQKQFGGIPGWFPSSSAINLNGDKYDTFLITSLSSDELYYVCDQTPGTTVLIGTSNIRWNNIQLQGVKEDLNVSLEYLLKKRQEETEPFSDVNGKEFKKSTKKLAESIVSDINKRSNTNTSQVVVETKPQSNTPTPTTVPKVASNTSGSVVNAPVAALPTKEVTTEKKFNEEEEVLNTHIYAIKEITRDRDGKPIYIFGDSHGGVFALNEEQLRNHAFSIISKRDNFPNIGERGLNAMLMFIGGTVLLIVGSNLTIRRLLRPEYKSLLEKIAIGLYNRVSKLKPNQPKTV